jgi:hypothetical protein
VRARAPNRSAETLPEVPTAVESGYNDSKLAALDTEPHPPAENVLGDLFLATQNNWTADGRNGSKRAVKTCPLWRQLSPEAATAFLE